VSAQNILPNFWSRYTYSNQIDACDVIGISDSNIFAAIQAPKTIRAILQHMTLAVLPPQVTAAPLVPAARLRED
jgi:hypothetical protein